MILGSIMELRLIPRTHSDMQQATVASLDAATRIVQSHRPTSLRLVLAEDADELRQKFTRLLDKAYSAEVLKLLEFRFNYAEVTKDGDLWGTFDLGTFTWYSAATGESR